MEENKSQRFYSEVSSLLKRDVTESSLVMDLKLDSMNRSEIIFLIEDIFGVDCWGKRLQDYVTLGDFLHDSLEGGKC